MNLREALLQLEPAIGTSFQKSLYRLQAPNNSQLFRASLVLLTSIHDRLSPPPGPAMQRRDALSTLFAYTTAQLLADSPAVPTPAPRIALQACLTITAKIVDQLHTRGEL